MNFPSFNEIKQLIIDAGLTTINTGAIASFYENVSYGHIASMLNALYVNGYLALYNGTKDQYYPTKYMI